MRDKLLGKKAITLNDVAKISQVSHQTVSRVINNSPHVSPATRKKVLKVIEDLGYRPNRIAQQLVTGKGTTVGIIGLGSGYYGPSQMISSIEKALRERDYGYVFASIESPSLAAMAEAMALLERHPIAALILINPLLDNSENLQQLTQNLPCVMVDTRSSGHPSVSFDQAYGSRLATEHLIHLGHRHICEISGPLHWYDAFERHQAWLTTMKEAGLEAGPSFASDWSAQGGYESALKLLKTKINFSGLVVGNDQMALGAMRALDEAGLRVPEDISVIGFDDVPEAAYFKPPLTTIRQDFSLLGQKSAGLVLELLEGENVERESYLIYPELRVRSSTAPHKP
ncbi:MAG: substrate-binding domain-containing protein [Deinococcales bacterium]